MNNWVYNLSQRVNRKKRGHAVLLAFVQICFHELPTTLNSTALMLYLANDAVM